MRCLRGLEGACSSAPHSVCDLHCEATTARSWASHCIGRESGRSNDRTSGGRRARDRRSAPSHEKKMIILHKGPAEHRDAWTSAPRGEPGTPPSVLTPQSPCTIERAVSVGTLYQDTIYAAAVGTNVTTPFCTGRGGSSIPSGRRRILVQGHPRPPPSHARAAILLQCQIKGNH